MKEGISIARMLPSMGSKVDLGRPTHTLVPCWMPTLVFNCESVHMHFNVNCFKITTLTLKQKKFATLHKTKLDIGRFVVNMKIALMISHYIEEVHAIK